MQLLPSLLHVLEVDKHAISSSSSSSSSHVSDTLASAYENGGMDWGNIAVYTCPNHAACCGPTEEYCVVQDSVDERPTGPHRDMNQGDAVIQEDAQFEDNDDEEDEGEGMINDDDGSIW